MIFQFHQTPNFVEFLVFKKSELLTKTEICRTPQLNSRTYLKISFNTFARRIPAFCICVLAVVK